jgi:hypothetical protein
VDATEIRRIDLVQLYAAIQRILEAPNSKNLDTRTLRALVSASRELTDEIPDWE